MKSKSYSRRIKNCVERFVRKIAPFTHWCPLGIRRFVRDAILRVAKRNGLESDVKIPLPYIKGKYPSGINLFGFFKAQNGLAQGAKLYAEALKETDIPYTLLNVDILDWLAQDDETYDTQLRKKAEFSINVVHINPDQWVDACESFSWKMFDHHYTIGVWLWELENIPTKWCDYFKFVNELWAPSEFIATALRKVATVPVTVIPYGIIASCDNKLTKADFKIKADEFVVLIMYDSNSYSSRKNPQASIKAFIKAFAPDYNRVKMVIKVNNPKAEEIESIKESIGDKIPYMLIKETLKKEELNSLIKFSSVFISLHRSEGFGLVMAEAMFLGIPVVATNWSANIEFMPEEAACMVNYSLIPVKGSYQYESDNQYWAEPDIDEAAAYLKRLYLDQDFYRNKAQAGHQYIANHYSKFSSAEKIQTRYKEICSLE